MYEDCGEGAPGKVISEMSCKGKEEFPSQRKSTEENVIPQRELTHHTEI